MQYEQCLDPDSLFSRGFSLTIISKLQPPVVGWAGPAVRLFNIHLRDLGIIADHVKGAVTQQGLKCENIPAGAQVGDREGVPEFVGYTLFTPARSPFR